MPFFRIFTDLSTSHQKGSLLRVAVKRLQSKITQNTKKQTNSRKSRIGLHKTGARTEGGHGSPKRRVKLVTHIRLASVGEENICGGVVRGIGSTDIRIRSRGVLYSSTSTVVSTRSLCPSTCLECPIVLVPVSSSPSCAWNLARGSVVVEGGALPLHQTAVPFGVLPGHQR